MKTEPIRDVGVGGTTLSVRKTAFCNVHSPLQNESASACSSDENNDSSSSLFPAEARAKSRLRLRKARKTLAESRNSSPILAVPVISPESIKEITDRVNFLSKEEFIRRLCSYWSLKRQSKNGVPLLHTSMSSVNILRDRGGKQTVQTVSTGSPSNRSKLTNAEISHVNLEEQFQYCKKLRQQLEKVRLLNELIRKRERLKQEHLKVHQKVLQLQLTPFISLLSHTLDQVQVKLQEAGFSKFPSNNSLSENSCAEGCLDLTNVRCKLNLHDYATVDEMASDINSLMSSSLPLPDGKSRQLGSCSHLIVQVTDILETASQISLKVGFDSKTGLHASNVCYKISNESLSVSDGFMEEGLLKEVVDTTSTLNGAASLESVQVNDKFTLHDKMELDLQVAYPVGVNRRSAVLHSKKANRTTVRLVQATDLSSENSVCGLPASKILFDKVDGVVGSDLFIDQNRIDAGGDRVTENKVTDVRTSVGALGLQNKNKDNLESFMKVESITDNIEPQESCITEGSCDVGKNEVKTEERFERKGRKRRRLESEVSSNTNSGDQGESGENQRHYITRGKKLQSQMSSEVEDVVIPLEPLDLVWAKCSGFPWYPALIIDPKISKNVAFHKTIPLPVPPSDVLSLRRKYSQPVFLVSFFDPRRSWQWLPRDKLDPLGVDSGLDSAKLGENKRPSMRHAVRIAYQKAINHRCLVTGEPLPSQSGAT